MPSPPAGSFQADFAAVEMLAQVLGDVPSGRLHKQLTEKQLASSSFAFAWALADPAVMIVGAKLLGWLIKRPDTYYEDDVDE